MRTLIVRQTSAAVACLAPGTAAAVQAAHVPAVDSWPDAGRNAPARNANDPVRAACPARC